MRFQQFNYALLWGIAAVLLFCTRNFENPNDPGSMAVPDAPSNVSVTLQADCTIKISWKHTGASYGFIVLRNSDTVFSKKGIDSIFIDSTFQFEREYTYVVYSFNRNGMTSSGVKGGCATVFAPRNATLQRTGSLAIIKWTDVCSFEDGFIISRSSNNTIYKNIDTIGPNLQMFTENNLADSTYYYRVSAFKGNKLSNPAILDSSGEFYAPTKFSIIPDNISGSIVFSWKNNSSINTGFILKYKSLSGTYIPCTTLTPGTSSCTFREERFDTSKQYIFHVVAVRDSLLSQPSDTVKLYHSFTTEYWKNNDIGNSVFQISPDSTKIAAISTWDNSVYCISAITGNTLWKNSYTKGIEDTILWSKDGSTILTCHNDSSFIDAWDVASGTKKWHTQWPDGTGDYINFHRRVVYSLMSSGTGLTVAARQQTTGQLIVRNIELASGSKLSNFTIEHIESDWPVYISKDGTLVTKVYNNNNANIDSISVWDVQKGSSIWNSKGILRSCLYDFKVVFSNDGKTMLICFDQSSSCSQGAIILKKQPNGDILSNTFSSVISDGFFSSDGNIVYANNGSNLQAVSTSSFSPLWSCSGVGNILSINNDGTKAVVNGVALISLINGSIIWKLNSLSNPINQAGTMTNYNSILNLSPIDGSVRWNITSQVIPSAIPCASFCNSDSSIILTGSHSMAANGKLVIMGAAAWLVGGQWLSSK